MIEIIWSGISGAIAAVVAVLITNWVIGTRLDSQPKTKLLVLVAVVVISASFARFIPNPLLSREAKALKNFSEQMLLLPSVKEKFKDISSEEEARSYGMMLSAKGIQKLDNSKILKLLDLRTEMANNADEETCAMIAKGKAAEIPTRILEPFSDEDLEIFLNITLEAMVAELDDSIAKRSLSEDEINAAVESFYEQLTSDEIDKFTQVSNVLETSTNEDACWAQRLLYERINLLNENERIIWSLSLTNTGE